jgi:hypothetical protein
MYINDDAIINEAQTMWHAHNRLSAELAENSRLMVTRLKMIERGCNIASRRFAEGNTKSALAWGKRIGRWQKSYQALMTETAKIAAELEAIDSRSALLPCQWCQCVLCTCTCDSDAYGVMCPVHLC